MCFSAALCWPFKSKLEAKVGESAKRPPPQSPPTLLMSKAACDAEWGIHILGCLSHTHSMMRITLSRIFFSISNGLVAVAYGTYREEKVGRNNYFNQNSA